MDVRRCIISGERGSGKTTLCQAAVEQAQRAGLRVGGLLSPARLQGGERMGIDALDLYSGERRRLASAQKQQADDLAFGNWFFDRGALAWGNQVLAGLPACDVLILDELGPLEFLHASGWTAAFEVIRRSDYRMALVVVRPALLERAERLLQTNEVLWIHGLNDVQPALQALALPGPAGGDHLP